MINSRIYIEIPKVCPICGQPTRIENNNGVEVLHCDNGCCPARQIGSLMNTFSKDGLFVKGLGESEVGLVTADPITFYTLEERVAKGGKSTEAYHLLMRKDGWGEKKWENLMEAIKSSRHTTLQKFLYALNIPLLGNDLSKKLSKYWDNDPANFIAFIDKTIESGGRERIEELVAIEGIGEEKARNIAEWCYEMGPLEYESFVKGFVPQLIFDRTSTITDNSLEGLTFVITGSVHSYKNRDEFKASVEARGGKVSGSVSAKTTALVNNDVESTSSKNQKAKALGVEILSEDSFIARYGK